MATRYRPVTHKNLARGIDAQSTFNNIEPGFSSELLNMDCSDRGALSKRKGYEGFHGDIPLRLDSIDNNGNGTATFNMDQEVNLLLTPSTPIVIYGDMLFSGTGTLSSSGTALTGVGTAFTTQLAVGSVIYSGGESRIITAVTDDTNAVLDEPFYGDLSGNIFNYRTLQQIYFPQFINESKINIPADAGVINVDFGHNSNEILSPISIARSDSASELDNTTIYPEEIIYDTNGLDCDIVFDSTELADDIQMYITSEDTDLSATLDTYEADITDTVLGDRSVTIAAGVHNLANLNLVPLLAYRDPADSSKYIRLDVDNFVIEDDGDIRIEYNNQAPMQDGGTTYLKLRIFDMPGSFAQESSFTAGVDKMIKFPDVDTQFNFTAFFLREPGATEQYQVYPDEISYSEGTQELCFTFTIPDSGTLKAVYMPGLVKSNRITVDLTDYPNMLTDDLPQTVMWGIPNQDVVYRASVTAGGELVGLDEYASASKRHLIAMGSGLLYKETTGELSLPTANVTIRRRIQTGRVVGPFFSTDVSQTRKMGADNIVDGELPILSITNNKDETADVVLNPINKVGTLANLVAGVDLLQVRKAGAQEYNGEFSMVSVDDLTNTITISVPGLPTWIQDDVDTGALGGVFTDIIDMSTLDFNGNPSVVMEYLEGDIINSTLFSESSPIVADLSGAGTFDLVLKNIKEVASLPSGAQLSVDRTTNIIPLDTIDNIVRGDMMSISGYNRKVRVLELDIDNSAVTIDESLLISDNPISRTTISIPGRWVAVESPQYNERRFIYFDSDSSVNQSRVRSARINDSVFMSNYKDPVMKYDGEHIYRAGVPAWQLQAHSWVDSTETGIVVPKLSYIDAIDDGSNCKIYFSELPDLAGVSTLYAAEVSKSYDIISVNETERYLTISGTAVATDSLSTRGQLSIPQEVAYYFKVQAVDANNNVVASAVTDYEESVIQLTKDGAVNHRITGMARFDIYDYDRLDVFMYRTKVGVDALPPFFQARREPINYRYVEGEDVMIINDTTDDESLASIPDDQVSIALKGAELPLSSEEPPRCKYLASIGGSLVLGNIKSYDTLDLDLLSNGGITQLNTMDNAQLTIGDGTSQVTVDCVPFMERSGGDYINLNATGMSEITNVEYPDSTTVRLTLSGSIGSSLLGEYVQLGSWFVSSAATGVYEETGRARSDSLGGLIGWWQVNAHTVAANDTIDLFWVHDRTAADNWAFGASEAPLYMGHSAGNLPVVQVPYSISSASGRTVTSNVFDDRKNQFLFTNAINRGLKDIRTALVQYMTRQDSPWLLPKAGATEGAGKLVMRALKDGAQLTGVMVPDSSSDLQIFWNQRRARSGDVGSGYERVFPSRLAVSVANYPEMFDNPFAQSALYGDSIIDINANDGQEITGLATFFATSTTSGANTEETVIVLKNKSVYAVNLATKQYQKLDSGNQGCTIPGSIQATKDGIMFANTSGIYMVTKGLEVIYVGSWLEDDWGADFNLDAAAERAIAITDGLDRKYKLSLPDIGLTRNDRVAVFNFISAAQLGGGWTYYDNFPASDWAQTNEGVYFSSYHGRVFRRRDAGNETDYRDDNQSIASRIVYAPQSFDSSGNRVVLDRIVSHIEGASSDVRPSVSVDLENEWADLDVIKTDGSRVGDTVASSLPSRHALYFQVQYEHDVIDEGFTLGGIDFMVSSLGETGVKQAKDTEG